MLTNTPEVAPQLKGRLSSNAINQRRWDHGPRLIVTALLIAIRVETDLIA
jgi:hypothetical protein